MDAAGYLAMGAKELNRLEILGRALDRQPTLIAELWVLRSQRRPCLHHPAVAVPASESWSRSTVATAKGRRSHAEEPATASPVHFGSV